MSGKHAKSVFYQGMYIIYVFHVILYIKIYFAQTRLCMVIVVNRRSDVSNAISSEISMDRKLAWVENCIGNYNCCSGPNCLNSAAAIVMNPLTISRLVEYQSVGSVSAGW